MAESICCIPRLYHSRALDARGSAPAPRRGCHPRTPCLYNIAPKVAAAPATLGAFILKYGRASPSTTALFRRRNYAPLSLVAIRACSSPCAVLRRSARLSRGCSSSRRENAETFASLLVPTELSRSSLIFTPRGYKRIRAPHRRYSDCYTKCQSRHSSAPGSPPKVFSVGLIRGPRAKICDFRLG